MANTITLSRLPLLTWAVFLLYRPTPTARILAAGLIIVVIFMDTLDGIVARWRGETSLLGSVLDIATDRAVELVLWVVFAHLGLIPVFVPLIVLTRGVFVDAVRAVATSKGLKPFDMMRSPLGRFLVKSPWLRTPYSLAKITTFFLLALAHGLSAAAAPAAVPLMQIAQVMVWVSLAFCILRGAPVLIEAPRALREEKPVA